MTYALAQRLSKQRKTAHLAPYVADMRRALGRGRKKAAVRAEKTPPDLPAPPEPEQ